jgi:sugar lactone lactonase YvrE
VANFFDQTVMRLESQDCASASQACGRTLASLTVNDPPVGIASAGDELWVASTLGGRLTRYRIDSGESLGEVILPTLPSSLLSAHSNLWTANELAGSVTLVGFDGTVLGEMPVGEKPRSLAADGNGVWAAVQGDRLLVHLAAGTGAIDASRPVDGQPSALAFDGSRLWVAFEDANAVAAIDPASGQELLRVDVGERPLALAFDGSSVWSADQQSGTVTQIDSEGGRGRQVEVPGGPYALAWVPCGAGCGDLWVVGEAGDTVSRIRIE